MVGNGLLKLSDVTKQGVGVEAQLLKLVSQPVAFLAEIGDLLQVAGVLLLELIDQLAEAGRDHVANLP